MKYERLIELVHYKTWVEPEKIKAILEVMADVLRENHAEDELTRTPLGTFFTHVREGKEWVLPDGSPTQIPKKVQVKLRPAGRLTQGWTPSRKAYLSKLVNKTKPPVWNPQKVLLDEDDELLEEDY